MDGCIKGVVLIENGNIILKCVSVPAINNEMPHGCRSTEVSPNGYAAGKVIQVNDCASRSRTIAVDSEFRIIELGREFTRCLIGITNHPVNHIPLNKG